MPDKWIKCQGTKTCLRCWQNKMKHACPQAKKWLKEHPEDASAQFEFGTVYRGVKSETKQRNTYWWEQKLCVEPDKPLQADVDVDEPLTTRQSQRKRQLKKWY